MLGLLLYCLADSLQRTMRPFQWAAVLYDCVRYNQWGEVSQQYLEGAWAIDITANFTHRQLLNLLFIKRGGRSYGQWIVPGREPETISSNTGKNWTRGRQTFLGEGLIAALDIIDPDHCYKYIQSKQPWPFPKPAPVARWKGWVFIGLTGLLVALLWILRWAWRAFCIYLAYQLYLWKNN